MPAYERGVFDIVVNGAGGIESIVIMRGNEWLVPIRDLQAAGLKELTSPTDSIDGIGYVSLVSLAPGATYTADLDALSIRVDAAAPLLGHSRLDLAATAPAGMKYMSAPAAFLNYAPTIVDVVHLEGFGELGVSAGPFLALATASHDDVHGIVRLMTNLTYDYPKATMRIVAGDTYGSNGALGGGAQVGGFSVTSDPELDPYVVRVPTIGHAGSVTTPSTLDVYVNGSLMKSIPVPAGQFNVDNVTPATGSGSVRYVLRDGLGREQSFEADFYGASGVLRPGLSEYGYTVGFQRESYGTESFDYGPPALLGRHRYGLSSAVTGGVRFEASPTLASGGVDLALAPGVGEIDLGVGVSAERDKARMWPGGAAFARYSASTSLIGLQTELRTESAKYAVVGEDAKAPRNLAEHINSLGIALPFEMAIAARARYAIRSDLVVPTAQLGIDFQTRIARGAHLTLGGGASYGEKGWRPDGVLTMTVQLPEHHSLAVTEEASEHGSETSARISRPIIGRTGVGYSVVGGLGREARVQAHAYARTGVGTATATFTKEMGEQHLLVGAAAGLAFVPGSGVFLSDPIDTSFAVVELPGVSGVRVKLNNQEIGRTDSAGYLLVPGLMPYQANRISIDAADLPIDYEAHDGEVLVAPTVRGAARVRVVTHAVRLVRGRVELQDGEASKPMSFGHLVVAGIEGGDSPIGRDGEFEIDGATAGRYSATVESDRGNCAFTLVVPESKEWIVELGALRCQPSHTERQP